MGACASRHIAVGLLSVLVLSLLQPGRCLAVQDSTVLAESGWWDWRTGPRAVTANGATYVGFVNGAGDVSVAMLGKDGSRRVEVLAPRFDTTGLAHVILAQVSPQRMLAFYSQGRTCSISLRAGDVDGDGVVWAPVRTMAPLLPMDPADSTWYASLPWDMPVPTCTVLHASFLSGEQQGVLVWRQGVAQRPPSRGPVMVSFTRDSGRTWSTGRPLFAVNGIDFPMVRAVREGPRVHFTVTTTRPTVRSNAVYYFSYENGVFRRAGGAQIGNIATLPLQADMMDHVYDAAAEGAAGWIWDIAVTASGDPVIAYARYPEGGPEYRYASWNGFRWVDRLLGPACLYTNRAPDIDDAERQFDLGGLALDPVNPRVVYASNPVDSGCAIERMFTPDNGGTWSSSRLDGDSSIQVRPVLARAENDQTVLLWLGRSPTDGVSGVAVHATRVDHSPYSAALEADAILEVMHGVGDWQLGVPVGGSPFGWPRSVLLLGLRALAQLPGGAPYAAGVLKEAEKTAWLLANPDDPQDRLYPLHHGWGQVHVELYDEYRRPAMLRESREAGDHLLGTSLDESLEWQFGVGERQWGFADALFFTPPFLARLATATDDGRYLEWMDRLWWKTTDQLFDREQRLFYRDSRYFAAIPGDQFWSRGNGWVMAGLARTYPYLPSGFPTRHRYEDLFRTMATRIADLQQEDGYWRSSLLEPEQYPMPETSGTGLFVFALAWGINEGLLDEETFLPVVQRGWAALVDAVDVNGKLGWSQPPSIDPDESYVGRSDPYTVGAFLLAGSQLYRFVATSSPSHSR